MNPRLPHSCRSCGPRIRRQRLRRAQAGRPKRRPYQHVQPRLISIDAAISGAKELYLVVDDLGGISCDWADWIEPKLILKGGAAVDLSPASRGNTPKGKRQGPDGQERHRRPTRRRGRSLPRTGSERTVTPSISYALPDGSERFQAQVAIDDGGMIRAGKPSDAKIQFAVFTEKPADPVPPVTYDPNAPKVVPTDLFAVPEGLEVTVWATSPLFSNPVNIDFDAEGRLYVAEGVNYRSKGTAVRKAIAWSSLRTRMRTEEPTRAASLSKNRAWLRRWAWPFLTTGS